MRSRVAVLALLALAACNGLTGNDQLPTGVTDPTVTQTPEGALRVYHGLIRELSKAFGGEPDGRSGFSTSNAVLVGGTLSDELLDLSAATSANATGGPLDRRNVPPDGTDEQAAAVYGALQKVRGQATQAIGLLRDYLPDSLALAGHAYAIQGYAEVFLAELFCSGVPLSTLDYQGDYTLKPGSSTTEVLNDAVALFDTALGLAGNDARFVNLARIGKARALLGMDSVAQAASTVGAVPDDYVYDAPYVLAGPTTSLPNFFDMSIAILEVTVADHEGLNGLAYISSGDPRTAVAAVAIDNGHYYWPAKYAPFDGSAPIVLASGVEARLIEAEAALRQGGGVWLDKLNALRTDGTFEERPTPDPNDDPAATDTLWHAGTGGVPGLAPLTDPGTESARVDLLFHERAFWLFLTGHRQGDLRRLIRWYGRTQAQVYPTGLYPGGVGSYGTTVMLPIPQEERETNPLFTGCASSGA